VQVPPAVVTVDGAGPVKRLELAVTIRFWASLGPPLVTPITNDAVPLPGLPDVDAVCAIDRSANVRTVPHVWAELLVLTGSVVAVDADALLHSCAPSEADDGSCTTNVNEAVVPTVIEAIEHDTVPVPPTAGVVHVQPVGLASDVNVVPAGIVSVIDTVRATLGPELVTPIV
jgi:hypothetical protein